MFEPRAVRASNVDALIKNVVSATQDYRNGQLLSLGDIQPEWNNTELYAAGDLKVDGSPVFVAFDQDALTGALSDGRNVVVGLENPQLFVNIKGRPFNAFMLEVGDKLLYTEDEISGTYTAGTTTFIAAATGNNQWAWASAAPTSGAYAKLDKQVPYNNFDGGFNSGTNVAFTFTTVRAR